MFSQIFKLDSLPIFCSKVAGKMSISGNEQKEIKLAKHRKSDLLQKIFLVKSIKNKFNVKINIDIAGLYRTWKFEYLFWKL